MKSSSSMERVSVQETAQLAGGGQSATNVREAGETAWEIWVLSMAMPKTFGPGLQSSNLVCPRPS